MPSIWDDGPPGATWLEVAISCKRSLQNYGFLNQVWARECWSTGIVGKKSGRIIYFPAKTLLQY